MKYPTRPRHQAQQGLVLIVCLFVLLAVTSLGIFGMRNVTLGERVAGNTLEKQRSVQAAESALRYGEWWLSTNDRGEYINCSGTPVNGNTKSQMRVCTNALSDATSLPWTGYTTYTPGTMKISTSGGLVAPDDDVNYYSVPQLYISYMGKDRRGEFFQISAAGYGGNENTVTVVQSTFTFSLNSIDLGGL